MRPYSVHSGIKKCGFEVAFCGGITLTDRFYVIFEFIRDNFCFIAKLAERKSDVMRQRCLDCYFYLTQNRKFLSKKISLP